MKKLIILIFAVTGMLAMAGCAQKKSNEMKQENNKVLVTYFSATGTTKRVAEDIARLTGGDLFEIAPEAPYTSADLNWNDSTSRSSVEMRDPSSHPAIKDRCDNIGDYDVVFIGFPIWWYTNPTIINTFIEAHDLKGKKLVVFATSGGSTIEKAIEDLKNNYPEYEWIDGALLNNRPETELKAWTDSIIK